MGTRLSRRIGMLAVTAIVSLVAVAVSSAAGGYNVPSGNATIKMKNQGKKKIFFTGPKTVKHGATLKIQNASDPAKIGPHTFSLVKKSLLPKPKNHYEGCAKEVPTNTLCLNIIKAQKANPKTGKVNKPNVDVGKKGWDKSFGTTGDTWFTGKKGDTQSRKVTAPAGTTLYYFCAVHPNMQGKIKVVK
jgi:plastocyanin